MKHLLPLAAVCLLCAGFSAASPDNAGIKVTDGYEGPIGSIGLKILSAAGANVEQLQADLPRSQRIQHAANAAAETFAAEMGKPLAYAMPNAVALGDCKDGACRVKRERSVEVKRGDDVDLYHKSVKRERRVTVRGVLRRGCCK